jgi:group II intron reverse transcriptase/maturase
MELLLRNMTDTPRSDYVSTVQQRIAELARERPNECFTALNHYLTVDWLKAAFERVKPDGAPGVDGQTWSEYWQNLDENLRSLLDRVKSGSYFAPPVKRVHIPKGDGKETRGIGRPTIEDKVVQRAIAMLLEPIFEQDFKDFSYGFRPGRSAHQALARIWSQCMNQGIEWIVEVDIRKYFDTLKKTWLRKFLDRRVRDGVIRRLIDKWLKAGVWEKGQVSYPEDGTPQGGVISPLLSNVYLHEVLDCWFVNEVLPRMKGYAFLVRFADDFILGFQNKEDAEKIYRVLFKRFDKYGLSLHPEKTRVVPFGRPEATTDGQTNGPKPGTFDYLGFTHYWGKSRKGRWVVVRQTSRKRLCRALKTMNQWCRKFRHQKLRWQVDQMGRKLKGHYGYYGLTGNFRSLQQYRWQVIGIWRRWLNRRSREHGSMPWARMHRLLAFWYIPPPRVVHSVYAKPSF